MNNGTPQAIMMNNGLWGKDITKAVTFTKEKSWPEGWEMPPSLQDQPLRVHLGCGTDTPSGWLNVDVRPLPGVDLVADLHDLPIPDGSAEQVVMRHILQHFPVGEVPIILAEIRRILQPQGMLELATPDHEGYLETFHPRVWGGDWPTWGRCFYGNQNSDSDFYRCCFAERFLPELMHDNGFQLVEARREVDARDHPVLSWNSRKRLYPHPRILFHQQDHPEELWVTNLEPYFQELDWQTKCLSLQVKTKQQEEQKLYELKNLLSAWKPDVFFAFPGWDGGPTGPLLDFLRAQGVLCLGWTHDEPYRFDGFDTFSQQVAPRYDVWFTNWGEDSYLADWKRYGVEAQYLPCVALPYLQRDSHVIKQYDLGFIGTYYEPRKAYLLSVSDLDLSLWLSRRGGPDLLPTAPVSLLERNHETSVHREITALINQTKINLDIAEQPDGRVRCAKTRLFEILNCGAFALTGRCPATLRHFEEGRDLECYDTPAELREKALYYLAHAPEREQIAENGWQAAQTAHTYRHRAMTLSKAALAELAKRDKEIQ